MTSSSSSSSSSSSNFYLLPNETNQTLQTTGIGSGPADISIKQTSSKLARNSIDNIDN